MSEADKMRWQRSPSKLFDWTCFLSGTPVYVRKLGSYWEAKSRRDGLTGYGNTREEAAKDLLAKILS